MDIATSCYQKNIISAHDQQDIIFLRELRDKKSQYNEDILDEDEDLNEESESIIIRNNLNYRNHITTQHIIGIYVRRIMLFMRSQSIKNYKESVLFISNPITSFKLGYRGFIDMTKENARIAENANKRYEYMRLLSDQKIQKDGKYTSVTRHTWVGVRPGTMRYRRYCADVMFKNIGIFFKNSAKLVLFTIVATVVAVAYSVQRAAMFSLKVTEIIVRAPVRFGVRLGVGIKSLRNPSPDVNGRHDSSWKKRLNALRNAFWSTPWEELVTEYWGTGDRKTRAATWTLYGSIYKWGEGYFSRKKRSSTKKS